MAEPKIDKGMKQQNMGRFYSQHPHSERKPYVILRNCEAPFPVIEVPATWGGKPVKEIRGFLLYNPKVEEVIVSEGIEVLGPGAIAFCEKLRSITLPHSLREIDERALNNDLKVRELHWKAHPDCRLSRDTFYFMRHAFDENGCFIRNDLLLDTSIGDWSDDRKSLVMPEGVKGICVSGLCEGKANIYLSSHHRVPVKTLKEGSAIEIFFEGANPLKSLSKRLFQWEFKTKEKQILHIGEGIESMEEEALVDCTTLTHVFLPKSLKRIEASAFQNCSNLEEITLPEGIKSIDSKTFKGCSWLKKIHLPKSLKKIGEDAFSSCVSLKELSLPDGVEHIGEGAFRNCKALEKVNIPLGLKEIPEDAFSNCGTLRELFLPKNVTKVGKGAFAGCRKLDAVVLEEEEAITIEQGAFPYREGWMSPYMKILGNWDREDLCRASWKFFVSYGKPNCPKDWVDVMKLILAAELASVENIAQEKVLCCKRVFESDATEKIALYLSLEVLKEVSHMDYFIEKSIAEKNTGVTAMLLEYKNQHYSVEERARHEMRQELLEMGMERPTLKELKERWGVRETQEGIYLTAYYKAEGEEVVPAVTEEGVKILGIRGATGKHGFGGLRSLVLEEGVQELDGDFSSLESIHLPEGFFSLKDNLFCGSPLSTLELPRTVVKAGKNLARNCKDLEEVVLSPYLKTISAYSFYRCESLKEVKFFHGVKRLKEHTFEGVALKEVIFPESLTIIEMEAFSHCPELECVVLPKNVKFLGAGVFSHCRRLTHVYVEGDIAVLHSCALAGCPFLQFVGKRGGENKLDQLRERRFIAPK